MQGKDGPARPSRFEVILPIPPYINQSVGNSVIEKILNFPNSVFGDISDVVNKALGRSTGGTSALSRYLALQCESAELPGKTFQTADVKIYGPIFKVPYQRSYADINLTFICSNQFYERKLFERWTESIMPPDTNNMRFPKGQLSSYYTQLKIIQYDDFIKQIYVVNLEDAYPVGVAPQPLSWSDDGFHRLSVSFAYQKYSTVYEGGYDIGQAAASLLGGKGANLVRNLF
tara:strand:+ start:1084 stop:1773 length:690 start_codon:yes stop_codon:yes gene_type:complete